MTRPHRKARGVMSLAQAKKILAEKEKREAAEEKKRWEPTPNEKLPADQQCAAVGHCWHVSDGQHTIDRHRDDVCCYCRASRCVQVHRPTRNGVGGHGPYRGAVGMEMVRDGD